MEADLKELLKRVFELVMPNLRAYYRMPHKAKVIKSYAADGKFYADVQPLHNNEEVNEKRSIQTKLEIPVLIGGKAAGIIGPPQKGTHCVLSYFDGDPDFPYISDFRWKDNGAPACELDALIIQKEDGIYIKIDAEKNIKLLTSADVDVTCKNLKATSETVVIDSANSVEVNTKESTVNSTDKVTVNTKEALVEATVKAHVKSPEVLLGEGATEKVVLSCHQCAMGFTHLGTEKVKGTP
jgi:hypothetical protein